MATVAATTAAILENAVTTDAEWSEAHIDSAMVRLQKMHAQLRHLRDTVALLVEPMVVQQPSPEILYNTFAQTVMSTKSDIRDFSSFLSSDGSKEVFHRADDSRARGEEDIRGWRVTEHEDWLDVRTEDIVVDVNPDSSDESMMARNITTDGMNAAVDGFKKEHPAADASVEESSRTLSINLPPPTAIQFQISVQDKAPAEPVYTVTCKENSNIYTSIVRHVNTVIEKQSLDYVLDLMSASSLSHVVVVAGSSTAMQNTHYSVSKEKPESKTQMSKGDGNHFMLGVCE
ncbi:MAG: hypothetical protein Q9220_001055 [cf. Caloplaca sp. 1 TL-2023]